MGDNTSEDCATESQSSSLDGVSGDQHCLSGDSLSEWRSSDQVENGNPSTSPSYWDTDDEDPGSRPSDLYGKFTWKIEGFSQISKRELRSNVFEVGGYKWYILIYPQGCDVCNHLSLFLCVADHDKLLPGWSHFAQFTIAVVNTDSKKSKYSDTLHRFWKKEHDWGWKKFMELSKVSDGFLVDDALVIKAQVQVIREKAHQPFRCLDCQYRRELVRVYLSNVEKLCRRYVEEKRSKFIKIIEDKVRWSSLHAFWLAVDHNTRRRMSRDRTEAVLKVIVKHFFIENEVTSTLVMDYLYTGLKVLECQSKIKDGLPKLLEMEDLPEPLIFIEKDVFVLTDDVLMILERAALEPLPPKDEKTSQNQNRLKEYNSGGDLESIELDERRLTELGRRTVEMFAVNHIFSMIEIAYQEAVAFRRQEELIREEEAAESELRSRRHSIEKDKRSKKKQVKQKKNSRKNKEKNRNEKNEPVTKRLEEIDIITLDALEEQSEDLPPIIVMESNPEDVATNNRDRNEPQAEERETSLIRTAGTEEDQTERNLSTLGEKPFLSTKKISPASKKTTNSRARGKSQQYFLHQNNTINKLPFKDDALPLERRRSSPVNCEPIPIFSEQEKQKQETSISNHARITNSESVRESTASSALITKPSTPVRPKSNPSISSKNMVLPSHQAPPFSPSAAPRLSSLVPSLSTVGHAPSYRNAIIGLTASGSAPVRPVPIGPELSFGLTASPAAQPLTIDEFPHLDIINDLLNEEHTKDEWENDHIPSGYSALDESYFFRGGHLYEQLIVQDGGFPGQVHLQPFSRSSVYVPGDFFYEQDYLDMIHVMNGFNGKFHPSNGH